MQPPPTQLHKLERRTHGHGTMVDSDSNMSSPLLVGGGDDDEYWPDRRANRLTIYLTAVGLLSRLPLRRTIIINEDW